MEGPALDWDRLPKRVEAVIAAHIARLPREQQELLAVASVEGDEFHAEVAARVLQRDEREVLGRAERAAGRGASPGTGAEPAPGGVPRGRLTARAASRAIASGTTCSSTIYTSAWTRCGAPTCMGRWPRPWRRWGPWPPDSHDLEDTRASLSDNSDGYFEAPEGIASEAQLAWHWEEAGLAEKAVAYHIRAAVRASHVLRWRSGAGCRISRGCLP